MTMRITIVTHYSKPRFGGIETISFEQARRLAAQGHRVTIVSSTYNGAPRCEIVEGVQVRRVLASDMLDRKFAVAYPLFSPSLLRVLDRELADADVCIIHGFAFQSSLAAAWTCVRRGVPYVLIQSNVFLKYENPLLNFVQRANDSLVGRYLLNHAAFLFAASHATRDYIQTLTARPVEVLYSGIDPEWFSPPVSRDQARTELGLPRERFIVLTTRRLVFKNAVDTLVAAAHLLRDDERVLFVIVGTGPDRQRIESYLDARSLQNCILAGAVPDGTLPDYYRAANLFALPSRTGEGFPTVLLEAMASGVPVVATRGGGQVEAVRENCNGFLIAPQSPDELADVIRACVQDPICVERMGSHARAIVTREFTWDIHMAKLMCAVEGVQ